MVGRGSSLGYTGGSLRGLGLKVVWREGDFCQMKTVLYSLICLEQVLTNFLEWEMETIYLAESATISECQAAMRVSQHHLLLIIFCYILVPCMLFLHKYLPLNFWIERELRRWIRYDNFRGKYYNPLIVYILCICISLNTEI